MVKFVTYAISYHFVVNNRTLNSTYHCFPGKGGWLSVFPTLKDFLEFVVWRGLGYLLRNPTLRRTCKDEPISYHM